MKFKVHTKCVFIIICCTGGGRIQVT